MQSKFLQQIKTWWSFILELDARTVVTFLAGKVLCLLVAFFFGSNVSCFEHPYFCCFIYDELSQFLMVLGICIHLLLLYLVV